ncbi:MAG: hypothetical protein ABSB56_04525 [Nitrososphaerales archaeon]|jgi:MFS family permease
MPEPTLPEKKQKFIEVLATLGSLLAVFLGFIVEKVGGILLTYTIGFGVSFVVFGMISYTAVMFHDRISKKWQSWANVAYLMFAISFGALVSLGTAVVLSLSIVGSLNWQTEAVASIIFAASFLGVYWVILKVLGLKEPSARTQGA